MPRPDAAGLPLNGAAVALCTCVVGHGGGAHARRPHERGHARVRVPALARDHVAARLAILVVTFAPFVYLLVRLWARLGKRSHAVRLLTYSSTCSLAHLLLGFVMNVARPGHLNKIDGLIGASDCIVTVTVTANILRTQYVNHRRRAQSRQAYLSETAP
eukprot:TRINITY_DN63191_c0_g1_i2.p2 TRINITY_DN63191_c0_g1~~TRINITY_DN63191_c0_g1_i2.p2  ORF type:complete len:159 (+),score=25.67 TRINITY_DN63191_c0_g1_i2:1143-1619(+)